MPEAHAKLLDILRTLERHYGDMQDTEFTIEEGRLFMLQTRNAKRPAQAAVRFATDAVAEGLLTKAQALTTIDAAKLDALLHPTFDPEHPYEVIARGVAASPGAAKGTIVFTAEGAVAAAKQGQSVILVRPFTEAEDVAGFAAAKGILTSEGGKASHAALVARGMGRPAVTGAHMLDIDLHTHEVTVGDLVLRAGDRIAIDGSTGAVTTDDVPLVQPEVDDHFAQVLEWADGLRRLGVRTNADTPHDARRARSFGAEGIGLCRTEHMFMAADRQPKVRRMIMAIDDDAARRAALEELLPLQQGDFDGLFEAMDGRPVTIRLLDPPLHEFLPDRYEAREELTRAELQFTWDLPELQHQVQVMRALEEANPMLGTRGVRLGILYEDIYAMQVRAIVRAARTVHGRTGVRPQLEIMIPLVAYEQELALMREMVIRVAAEEGMAEGDYRVGTMIELPRACLVAADIARHAEFFSFGTNDLTQTGLGFSRDDIEGSILPTYIARKILDVSPFESIDEEGLGQLVTMGVERGRSSRPDLHVGVCGEHGGDPSSIRFFHHAGLDYVSCSPFRVPIARVAAAQAAIEAGQA
jgi:pyruvate,orthophosphate dikinase